MPTIDNAEFLELCKIICDGRPSDPGDWSIQVRAHLKGSPTARKTLKAAIGQAITVQHPAIMSQFYGSPLNPPQVLPHAWAFQAADVLLAHYKAMIDASGLRQNEEETVLHWVQASLTIVLGPEWRESSKDSDMVENLKVIIPGKTTPELMDLCNQLANESADAIERGTTSMILRECAARLSEVSR